MKNIVTISVRVLGMWGLLLWLVPISFCDAAPSPLPQRIISSQLQRDDCFADEIDADDQLVPYIQEFIFTDTRAGISLYSCVNWRGGFLKSEGIGKKGSRRAAELVARNNALRTVLVVNVHSKFSLQDYFQRQAQVRIKIQNVLIKNAAIEDLTANPERPDEVAVMVTIPFYGISGLNSFLLDDQELYLEPPASPKKTQPTPGEYTGIIIDVRGLPNVQPALLPKIVSQDGEILYEASQVNKEVLQSQGMVEYVSASPTNTAWRSGERPFMVKPVLLASASPSPNPSHQGRGIERSRIYSPPLVGGVRGGGNEQLHSGSGLLAQTQTRQRRRRGNNLIVEATEDAGEIPVNVVVSVEDAKKIKQLNEANQFDNQGKYTILIGGEIGGVKGQYPGTILARQDRE